MTVIVGGLRARLIRESLFNAVKNALADLGWFDTGRQHEPITFTSAPIDDRTEIRFNTIAMADADVASMDWEIGTLLAEHNWTFYIDIYAESNALGMQLAHDIKDILQGRLPSVGRDDPSFDAYDYREATPSIFTTCQIDNVMVDRAQGFAEPWRRWWYSVAVTVLDYYGTEDDA